MKEIRVNIMTLEKPVIERKVNHAIQMLFKNDSDLLKRDVNERSITHKLAEYLQIQFDKWNVDCEYNKNGDVIKELEGIKDALNKIPDCVEHITTDRVFPDIIIHLRGDNTSNLLVIEVKKRTNPNNSICDEKKLELFTQKGQYHYSFGLFIKFNGIYTPEMKWFKEGRIMNTLSDGNIKIQNKNFTVSL